MFDKLVKQKDGLKPDHTEDINQTTCAALDNHLDTLEDDENNPPEEAVPEKTLRRKDVSIILSYMLQRMLSSQSA